MSFQMFLSDCLIPLFIQIITCPSDFCSTMGKIKKGNDLSWQPWWESEWHYYAPRLISAHSQLPIEKTEGHDCLSVSHLLIGWYIIEMFRKFFFIFINLAWLYTVHIEMHWMQPCAKCHFSVCNTAEIRTQCWSLQTGCHLITRKHSGCGLVKHEMGIMSHIASSAVQPSSLYARDTLLP